MRRLRLLSALAAALFAFFWGDFYMHEFYDDGHEGVGAVFGLIGVVLALGILAWHDYWDRRDQ